MSVRHPVLDRPHEHVRPRQPETVVLIVEVIPRAGVRLRSVVNTVAVYFTEGSQLNYQEADPSDSNGGESVWLIIEGVSNPFHVDDDNDEELQTLKRFFALSCTCDTLSGSMVFWTKAFGSGSGGGFSQRLQVRVRDGGNDRPVVSFPERRALEGVLPGPGLFQVAQLRLIATDGPAPRAFVRLFHALSPRNFRPPPPVSTSSHPSPPAPGPAA